MLRCHVISAVFKRNVLSYFSGVLGYLFIVVFVVAAAALTFTPQFFSNNVAGLDQLNDVFPLLLLFIIPAITMSAWADEKKLGTEELLFTLPATDLEILLAKYLSVLFVYTIALGFSLFQLFVLAWYADPDWGLLFTTYLGYWLTGAALLSGGMFASALTGSTTVSFVLGVALCAIPVFLTQIVQMIGVVREIPQRMMESEWSIIAGPGHVLDAICGFFAALEFDQLSLSEQFREFGMGLVPLSGLVYFGSVTAFMLYLNYVVITRRHWSAGQRTRMGLQYAMRMICLVVVLTSANVIARGSADVLDLRADLTADNAYSLSATTQELIAAVDERRPVTIQAFISEEVPRDYVPVRKRLIGLLRQYDRLGGNDLDVRIVNVGDAYGAAAREAQSAGITKQREQTEEGGRLGLSEFFLGVLVSSPYDEVAVASFDADSPIEYELTRSVRTVSGKLRRVVGVLQTDAGVNGGFSPGAPHGMPVWGIIDELKKQYEVADVSPDQPYDEQRELVDFEPRGKTIEQLDAGKIPDQLREELARKDRPLSAAAKVTVDEAGSRWRIADEKNRLNALVVKSGETLTMYGGFDVLLAVLPSSLTQTQMARFVEAIEAGQPTLIFDDPMPVTIGLQHAPMVPKRPPGGMFGRSQPPEPRADGGKATSLMNALDIVWDSDDAGKQKSDRDLVVTFDYFNPHPKIEQLLPPEFVFISPDSGVASALNQKSKITAGFEQMLALFPGRIKPRKSDLEFEALLRTGRNSGEIAFGDLVDTRNPFTGPRMLPDAPHFRDDHAHTLAAHIHTKKDNGIDVVYVADADLVSDYTLFDLPRILRQGFDYEYQSDNVSFVLNAVDLLAGDDDVIALRNRQAKSRPLKEIQNEVNKFREQRQQEEEERQKEWEKEQEAIQKQFDEAKKKVDQESGSAIQQLITAVETADRRLQQRKEEIEREKQQTLDMLKGEEREKVESLETRIRWQAVLLPPIPALMLGLVVLLIRMTREGRNIQPGRSIKS